MFPEGKITIVRHHDMAASGDAPYSTQTAVELYMDKADFFREHPIDPADNPPPLARWISKHLVETHNLDYDRDPTYGMRWDEHLKMLREAAGDREGELLNKDGVFFNFVREKLGWMR